MKCEFGAFLGGASLEICGFKWGMQKRAKKIFVRGVNRIWRWKFVLGVEKVICGRIGFIKASLWGILRADVLFFMSFIRDKGESL